MVVDELVRRHGGSFRAKFRDVWPSHAWARPGSPLARDVHERVRRSIAAAARFFKVAPEDVLVVHDDVDLDVGRLQARLGEGSPATTACARSHRHGTQEFLRVRIGIGRPGAATDARSPTTSSPCSRRRTTSTPSWRAPLTRSSRLSRRGFDATQRRFN
jgi:PTH1 family peptidyl-tRNA hydrolase